MIAPVKLRAVASGLMIEKVRSIAIGLFFKEENTGARIAAAYSDHALARQGVTKALVIERDLVARAKRQREATLPLQRDEKRPPHANSSAAPFPCPEDLALFFIEAPLNPPDHSPD
ncbi:MAG TPA: hypothetical protein VFV12_13570 [Xanthobacteraceae bacterium]|nr:hypothetical protein [Xanthobacteraceae bacterium]